MLDEPQDTPTTATDEVHALRCADCARSDSLVTDLAPTSSLSSANTYATIGVVAAMVVAPWLGERDTRAKFPDEVAEQEESLTAAIDSIDVDHRTERSLVLDDPRHALGEAAGSADLIVVGARGHGVKAMEFLGSVSTWMLQDCSVPVVVVPHGG